MAGIARRSTPAPDEASSRAQCDPLRVAIWLGARTYDAAAGDGIFARIHHAGLDRAAGGLAARRKADAEPHRRCYLRRARRAGDPTAWGCGYQPGDLSHPGG